MYSVNATDHFNCSPLLFSWPAPQNSCSQTEGGPYFHKLYPLQTSRYPTTFSWHQWKNFPPTDRRCQWGNKLHRTTTDNGYVDWRQLTMRLDAILQHDETVSTNRPRSTGQVRQNVADRQLHRTKHSVAVMSLGKIHVHLPKIPQKSTKIQKRKICCVILLSSNCKQQQTWKSAFIFQKKWITL